MTTTTIPQHELTSTMDADTIETLAKADLADDVDPTVTVERVPARIMDAITGSADYVILTSSDGAVFLGEVQDWDDSRMEIVVKLS
jgi:hypothetical protein